MQAEALESASESVSTHRKQRAITLYDREEVPYGQVLHSEREVFGACPGSIGSSPRWQRLYRACSPHSNARC